MILICFSTTKHYNDKSYSLILDLYCYTEIYNYTYITFIHISVKTPTEIYYDILKEGFIT